jgi:hypothetical protein
VALLSLLALAVALSGCPFQFEEEERENFLPNTFFSRFPPDTTFSNEVSFTWLGTDLDSDVVAFQYQFVEVDSLYYFTNGLQGEVIRSLDPRSESGEERWTDRLTDNFQTFRDLDDGWYEMRTRAIDARQAADDTPASRRVFVFFDDVPPMPMITNTPRCGRIGSLTGYLFSFTASDASRRSTTPRSLLQYRVQLRSISQSQCPEHAADGFTGWQFFPSDDFNDVITVGDQAPTNYQDLFSRNCTWTFTLQVRDPAGLITTEVCEIKTG